MADRTNQTEIIYDKTGKKVVEGTKGDLSTVITGLTGGTTVTDGDYKISFKDATTGLESEKVDVPGFTVEKTPDKPADVKADATSDGANVSAD